jgi:hypothetical protein
MNFTIDSEGSLPKFLHHRCVEREEKGNSHSMAIIHYQEPSNSLEIATVFFEHGSRDKRITIAVYVDPFLQLGANFVEPGLEFPLESRLTARSLHPPAHCHEICFWIPNSFTPKHFACASSQLLDKLLKNSDLLMNIFAQSRNKKVFVIE